VSLIDLIEYPALRFGSASNEQMLNHGLASGILPAGQYAFAEQRDGAIYLARDPIGCNKLFFGHDAAGNVVVANRITRVSGADVPLSSIASCAPGHILQVTESDVRKIAGRNLFDLPTDSGLDIPGLQQDVRATLESAFAWLAREFTDSQFVVCLSGGLDSSIVASYAATHLPGAVAASFTYLDDEELPRHAFGTPSEQLASASDDFHAAARVASSLKLPLLPVVRPRAAVAAAVRASVHLCQDWRDFNVHCATVNVFLAQDVRAAYAGRHVVVLTGDLMNEYVCDYREERIDDTIYYRIPRVPAAQRRQYFVRGLDAGDREIGVFHAHGLTCCQPFALLAERYLRVPADRLEDPDIKWTMNAPLVSAAAAPFVRRAKTRAQVGGKDCGTLGIYHRLGIDAATLRQIWQEQFPREAAAVCDAIIQFGRYRAPEYSPGP
jgi:asparagine synthetase B (glutamine-hydrolysing)